jgi:hypothetical protein
VQNHLARIIISFIALALFSGFIISGAASFDLPGLEEAGRKNGAILLGGFLSDVIFIAATRRLIRLAGEISLDFDRPRLRRYLQGNCAGPKLRSGASIFRVGFRDQHL